jgi:hypothetical protein
MKSLRGYLAKVDPMYLVVALITIIGAYPRLFYAWSADFPLNDGGLFFTMIKDLEKAGFAIPLLTSYNSGNIPFAYPPLGFYLVSFLTHLLNYPLMDMLRLLPPLLSILTIPVFYILSQSILKDRLRAVYATFAFAVLPTSFDWMIMGGGITRSLGLLVAVLLLFSVQRFLDSLRLRILPWVAGLVCLVVLSHIGIAWFAAYSLCLFAIFSTRDLKVIGRLFLAAVCGVILAAPWWLTVISRHGLAPFLSAGQNAFLSIWTLAGSVSLLFTNEPILDLLAVMGFIGIAICIRDRKYFLLTWFAAIIVFQGRFWQICVILPFAMLAGIGIDAIVHLLDSKMQSATENGSAGSTESKPHNFPRSTASRIALVYMVIICFASAILAAPKEYISRGQRDAMQWIAANTPPESSFVVVTGVEASGVDAISEWFPALTQRVSIATPQGYEWMGGDVFNRRNQLHSTLQLCATINCLEAGILNFGYSLDYVYLALPEKSFENKRLSEELLSSSDFVPIYRSSEVIICARRKP